MEISDLEDLVDQVLKVKRARGNKKYYFWFCPKGPDDQPILLIERKPGLLKKRGREARKKAKVKIFAEGEVEYQGKLYFITDSKLQAAKVERLFKSRLGTDKALKKITPFLKKAKLVGTEEYEQLRSDGELQKGAEQDAAEEKKVAEEANKKAQTSAPQDPLQKKFAELYKKAGLKVQEAREVLGADHFAVQMMRQAQNPIRAAHKAGAFAEAIRLLEAMLADADSFLQGAATDAWDNHIIPIRAAYAKACTHCEEKGKAVELKALKALHEQMMASHDVFKTKSKAAKQAEAELAYKRAVTLMFELEAASENALAEDFVDDGDTYELDDELRAQPAELIARWRQTLGAAESQLARFKHAVLRHPGIVVDPRYAQIDAAIRDFQPLPDFGDGLTRALDDWSTADESNRAARRTKLLGAVDAAEKTLAKASVLEKMEDTGHGGFDLHTRLTSSFRSIREAV